ncbi:MAG: YggT family protein [Clostridiales bacterium]|jgi:YggT family protein|nr:YggT family protein [Clostridiales bacterium]
MLFIYAVNLFFRVLTYLILARAILSWFIRPGDKLYPLYIGIIRVTEPMLAPCRRIVQRFGLGGTIDFSPLLALIILWILNSIIIDIIRMLILL